MKRLFDNNDRYTPDASKLCAEVNAQIKTWVKMWIRKGYSARDIQLVLQNEVTDCCLEEILDSDNYD